MTFERPQVPLSILLKRGIGEPLTEEEQAQWDAYERDFETWEKLNNSLGIVDLADVMEEGPRPPEMLVPDLVVRGVHHIVFGTKESGKTWLVMACAAAVMARGDTVVWVDEEMGRDAVANRLLAFRVPPDTVRERMVYSEFATFDLSTEHRALWSGLLQHHRPTLVVVDAHTEVLATAELNENSGTDVSRWHMAYMAPALALGGTTMVIDHTGHDPANQGRATGSRHKGAQSKVELAVTLAAGFDRETLGRMDVSRAKNTLSAPIPAVQSYELGGENGEFVFRSTDAAAEAADDDRDLRVRVAQALPTAGRLERGWKGLGVNQLYERTGGSKSKLTQALREMVEDGLVHVEERGQSRLHSLTEEGENWLGSATGSGGATT